MLDLMLDEGSALAVADFAAFRQPWAKVMFLTDSAVFSDGSIFTHCQNACGYFCHLDSGQRSCDHRGALRSRGLSRAAFVTPAPILAKYSFR